MYSITYTSIAIKDMNELPHEVKKRIFHVIGEIKEDPSSYVKKLKMPAKSPLYSLRVGEYRVIMLIKDPLLIIQVVKVGNRSKVYRKF